MDNLRIYAPSPQSPPSGFKANLWTMMVVYGMMMMVYGIVHLGLVKGGRERQGLGKGGVMSLQREGGTEALVGPALLACGWDYWPALYTCSPCYNSACVTVPWLWDVRCAPHCLCRACASRGT